MSNNRLTTPTRDVDRRRTARLLLAWLDGDKLALDVVLDETEADPIGPPSLLFALTAFAADTAEQAAPDVRDQLRAALLEEEED